MDNVIQIRIDNDTKMRSASVFEKDLDICATLHKVY